MSKPSFYRPDIDGLRALAIIPVILFHAGISGFSGGFVGVDIFFVISGYLITAIILREIKLKRFSLIGFWERRVRRIIPVLFFILGAVTLLSYYIILFPTDFVQFGQSLLAQSVFLANLYYMRQYSYFAEPAEVTPLLHTWSLSIEEQFYVLFPLLLMGVWLLRKFLVPMLCALAALSFLYNIYLLEWTTSTVFSIPFLPSIWGGATNASAAFFFLPARAWELLIGAIIAAAALSIKHKLVAEIAGIIGIIGIIYSVVFFSAETVFPGYAALLPTLSTGLLILASSTHQTFAGTILSFPVLIWIGLISYSLYLWHWPLLVMTKMHYGELSQLTLVGLLAVTFILSWGTYRFIETPFRNRTLLANPTHMLIGGMAALGLLFMSGLVIVRLQGLPERAPAAALIIATAAADTNPRQYECFKKNYREIFGIAEPCLLGIQDKQAAIDFVLWGDSHSDAMMPVIDAMARERGQTGAYFGTGGCLPLVANIAITRDSKCEEIKQQALTYIEANAVPKVLLIASWISADGNVIITNEATQVVQPGLPSDQTEAVELQFADILRTTVETIADTGAQVYILRRVPIHHDYQTRSMFTEAARTGESASLPIQSLAEYVYETRYENDAISQLNTIPTVTVLTPTTLLCPNDICRITIGDTIAYRDASHVNTAGALLLRPVFEEFFESK